jgi:hypothetical protein
MIFILCHKNTLIFVNRQYYRRGGRFLPGAVAQDPDFGETPAHRFPSPAKIRSKPFAAGV